LLSSNAKPGKRLYVQYGCVGCHGETGVGMGGAADLRRANEHYPNDADLRAWIEDAPSKKPGTRMPAWKGIVRDEDYALLMTYIRSLASASGAREALNRSGTPVPQAAGGAVKGRPD
jgi:mono/diheme cytochrome c family protein